MGYAIPSEQHQQNTIDWLKVPLSELGAQASEWIVRTLMQQLSNTDAKNNPDYWEVLKTVSTYMKHLPRRSGGWTPAHEQLILDVLQEIDPEVRKRVVEKIREYEQALEAAEDEES